ncbi:MAG: PorT family protein [Prevotella sp.]|nr:PorT family protein [Prevotella sp.]
MKRYIVLIWLISITLTINADNDYQFIVKGGIGSSSVVGKDADVDALYLAHKIDLSYDWCLSERVSVMPTLGFACKGFNSDRNYLMYYVQMPVIAAYKIPIAQNKKFSFEAGPYIAYGLFSLSGVGVEQINIFKYANRFDFGAVIGINYQFNRTLVGIEYSHALTKLASNVKAYNQVLEIVCGYKF